MKEYIYKRKAVRSFKEETLSEREIQEISNYLKKAKPLFPSIKYQVVITEKIKNSFNVKAPYYLLFYSESEDGYLENLGFVGQQICLYLNSIGFGNVWLGGGKPKEKSDNSNYVICVGFGKPAEDLFRTSEDFKRKDIKVISNKDNEIIEAARLAPSAINAQDWFFYQDDNLIHCYHRKADFPLNTLLGHMSGVDLGIALCHMFLVSKNATFEKTTSYPQIKNCVYFITMKI